MEERLEEDSSYIIQFLSGEEAGFEALVRKYQDKVLNIVYSFIRHDAESEDIVQEVFLKVYRSLESFKGRSAFPTWLYRITVNTVYDFLRKRRGFLRGQLTEESVYPGSGPRESLLEKEKERTVSRALAAVPFKFRAAVVLKDIEGLSYAEISEVLRCGIGTVESRIFRARQMLKREILKISGESK
ncbi:MAG: sigma-70 family RNA polymerase sigma factor [Candidatus Omnitrophota bacterium]